MINAPMRLDEPEDAPLVELVEGIYVGPGSQGDPSLHPGVRRQDDLVRVAEDDVFQVSHQIIAISAIVLDQDPTVLKVMDLQALGDGLRMDPPRCHARKVRPRGRRIAGVAKSSRFTGHVGVALRGHVAAGLGPEHPPAEAAQQASYDEHGGTSKREPVNPILLRLMRPIGLAGGLRGLSALAFARAPTCCLFMGRHVIPLTRNIHQRTREFSGSNDQ